MPALITSVAQNMDGGFLGLPVGNYNYLARSYINSAAQVTGVTDLVPAVVNNHAYTVTINGIPVSFTSGGAATAANVRDGIIAAIQAIAGALALVTPTASGNNVRLTEVAPAAGAVTIAGADGSTTITPVAAHVSSQPLPPGIAVAKGGSGDQDLRLMSVTGDQILGVVLYSPQAIQEDVFGVGSNVLYGPNSIVPVMTRGAVWVMVEESVTPLSPVFVRFSPRGVNVQVGGFRASADAGPNAVAWPLATYRSTASAGQLARLEINTP